MRIPILFSLIAVAALAAACSRAGVRGPEGAAGAALVAKASESPQTRCPMTGERIDKSIYVDARGKRIYACCPGCKKGIAANPEKAIAKIAAKGETPAPLVPACTKCGQIKGSAKCCSLTAAKCAKCGLHKRSPGCCKLPKAEAAKCAKCGPNKACPGACKLPKTGT